ncbi:integrase core domain-containing protein [Haloferula chungangensis]|uniref:Integrase core domain-containing protein n=1 Tax=Haloferula chungangensis TaxID=1048331 RepID=A0ABW2L2U7_9BACT
MTPSRTNTYDNAWTESVIGTLRSEMLQGGSFSNEHDARTELFAYIESYYNTHRKHSALDYRTPAQFEADFTSQN